MDMKRRNFLKGAGGLAASMCMPLPFLSSNVYASVPSNPKKLVILMFMGGNDGINTAIPLDQYSIYSGLRPDIGIPQAEILPVGVDVSGMNIGLHPAMASLMPFKDKLAVFPATHTGVGSNRSHFLQHDLYDEGLATGVTGLGDAKGWVGRYLDNKYTVSPGGVVAQDFAASALGLMRGSTFVLDIPTPNNLDLGAGSAAASDAIWNDIRVANSAPSGSYPGRYARKQEELFGVLDTLKNNVDFGRIVDSSVTYPAFNYASTQLGQQFKMAADMFLGLPEIEVVHILLNGFDTHKNQGGTAGQQANLLRAVSDSLAAFYTDLGSVGGAALQDNVAVVTMTEFGRTAKQNVTGGTDHGQASCWFAFGGSVKGGVYDSYPGLAPLELENSNWLKSTTDYRDILSELLGPKHLGSSNPNGAFPNYAGPVTPLNFLV